MNFCIFLWVFNFNRFGYFVFFSCDFDIILFVFYKNENIFGFYYVFCRFKILVVWMLFVKLLLNLNVYGFYIILFFGFMVC